MTMFNVICQDLLGIDEITARKFTWFLESHEE